MTVDTKLRNLYCVIAFYISSHAESLLCYCILHKLTAHLTPAVNLNQQLEEVEVEVEVVQAVA